MTSASGTLKSEEFREALIALRERYRKEIDLWYSSSSSSLNGFSATFCDCEDARGAFFSFRGISLVEYDDDDDDDEKYEAADDGLFFENFNDEEEEISESIVAVGRDKNNRKSARVDVDVVYSPSYEVPVLCVRAFESKTGSALNIDLMNKALVVKVAKVSEKEMMKKDDDYWVSHILAPWDRTTQPDRLGGWLCVHPCETVKSMKTLFNDDDDDEKKDVEYYLEKWIRYAISRLKIHLPLF
jgi:hypothetical protein